MDLMAWLASNPWIYILYAVLVGYLLGTKKDKFLWWLSNVDWFNVLCYLLLYGWGTGCVTWLFISMFLLCDMWHITGSLISCFGYASFWFWIARAEAK